MDELTDKRMTKVALDLLHRACEWRRAYERDKPDPDDPHMLHAYDVRRTEFGDDAFDLLMDYTDTDGLEEWTSLLRLPVSSPPSQHPSFGQAD